MNPPDERRTEEVLDQQLVAYLDGELDADSRDQIERQLAEDAHSRDRLRDLQQTWDLLDHLPSSQTDNSFTETTVELVAAKASEEVTTQQRAVVRRRRISRSLAVGMFVAAAALGYLAFWGVSAENQKRLLRDLPVVENMDWYLHAESVSFLHQLDQGPLFAPDEMPQEEEASGLHRLFTRFDVASVRRRAAELTPVEKALLQSQKQRFDRLAPDVQDQMRKIHASVIADPDSDRLFHVMAQYYEWLKSLSPGQRSELLELPVKDRLARIEQIKRQQDALRFHLVATQTSESDFQAIVQWFRGFVSRHEGEIPEEKILRGLTKEDRQRWERWDSHRRRMFLMRYLPHPNEKEIEDLAKQLSPDARRALISEKDPSNQVKLVLNWMRAAFVSRMRPSIDPQKLQQFFKELDPVEREKLVALPKEQFDRQLRHLYFQRRFKRGERGPGPPLWGPPRFGSGPGPPPRDEKNNRGRHRGPSPRRGRQGGARPE